MARPVGRSLGAVAPPALLFAASLAVWQAAVALSHTPVWLLPSPLTVAHAAWAGRGLLWTATSVTAGETLVGFGAAVTAGGAAGIALFTSAPVRRALYPWLVVSQTVPVISLAPILAVWLGFGLLPKVIVVGLMSFFPVAVTTADALGRADPDLVRLMRSLGVRPSRILWEVRLPSAVPAIFSGLRLAAAYAVVGAVVAEWSGSEAGLGYTILRASSQFATAQGFAAIAASCLLGIALFATVGAAEHFLVPWARPVPAPDPIVPISERSVTA